MKMRVAILFAFSAAVLLCTPAIAATVSLQLVQRQNCGDRNLLLDLYAVADPPDANVPLAALDVVLQWDPTRLLLLDVQDPGPYPYAWLFSGFPNDSQLDNLNGTWTDGNTAYSAYSQLGGVPASAVPAPGLLVKTFTFRVLTVQGATTVTMPRTFGRYSKTMVYDGQVAGLDITGTLSPGVVTPGTTGDTNCDGAIDFRDINPFVLALSSPTSWMAQYPGCNFLASNDMNCDGLVDFRDINPFVAILSR
jgi:hypothetical protein